MTRQAATRVPQLAQNRLSEPSWEPHELQNAAGWRGRPHDEQNNASGSVRGPQLGQGGGGADPEEAAERS